MCPFASVRVGINIEVTTQYSSAQPVIFSVKPFLLSMYLEIQYLKLFFAVGH